VPGGTIDTPERRSAGRSRLVRCHPDLAREVDRVGDLGFPRQGHGDAPVRAMTVGTPRRALPAVLLHGAVGAAARIRLDRTCELLGNGGNARYLKRHEDHESAKTNDQGAKESQ
jgi:hypothetical protein